MFHALTGLVSSFGSSAPSTNGLENYLARNLSGNCSHLKIERNRAMYCSKDLPFLKHLQKVATPSSVGSLEGYAKAFCDIDHTEIALAYASALFRQLQNCVYMASCMTSSRTYITDLSSAKFANHVALAAGKLGQPAGHCF